MAASNMTSTTNTDDKSSPSPSSSSSLTHQLLHKPAVKKLAAIILSFIPAFLALSIINVIFTHAFVLSSYLFGASAGSSSSSVGIDSAIVINGGGDANRHRVVATQQKRAKKQKTVFVAPTQHDLEQILIELESSEPLPDTTTRIFHNNNGESSPTKRVQSVIASWQSLLEQRSSTNGFIDDTTTSLNDVMEELSEAYNSFVKRFEEDIDHYYHRHHIVNQGEDEMATLAHLPKFMKRKSLLDLDRHALEVLFDNVIDDVNLLIKDETILRNSNQALMKLLNSSNNDNKSSSSNIGASATSSSLSSCDSTFLDLTKGNPTPELATVVDSTTTTTTTTKERTPETTAAAAAANDASITADTARESDLYERIAAIKQILSRRELSGGGNKDPIDEEGVAAIRAEINAMATNLRERRQAAFAHEKELKQHLMEETSLLTSIQEGDTDDAMCASPAMVEKMVHRGLDSIRSQADLQSTLITTVFNVVADESDDGEFKQIMDALNNEMKEIVVPRIDYSRKNSVEQQQEENKNRPPKTGRKKTLSYVADGPLLHRGIAGMIDSFVDFISGYNDHVDEVFDYIMSRQGVSVGTATSDAISNLIRKVPLPELDRLRQSGILGGRVRSLVEE